MAVIWFAFALTALAQAPQPASRFDITRYAVEGLQPLKADDFSRIIAPFVGKQKTAADVQKAQQALQRAYLDLGHCSVQVTVPTTVPDAGVITFRLVQMPAPLSKDCLPTVVLDEGRATPPVTLKPGEVAVRPFSDVSGLVPEEIAPPRVKPEIARAPAKPLQDSPVRKPLQDSPGGGVPAPRIAIVAVPATREESAANVTVKPLAEVPVPQPGLVASTDVSGPPPAAKPPMVPVVPAAAPTAAAVGLPVMAVPKAVATPAPPAVAAPAQPVDPIIAPDLAAIAVAPQIAQAPKVEPSLAIAFASDAAARTSPYLALKLSFELAPVLPPTPEPEVPRPTVAILPTESQLRLKSAIALALVLPPTPETVAPSVTIAVAQPDKAAPKVATVPATAAAVLPAPQPEIVTKPSPVVSEPAKPATMEPTPVAPLPAPRFEPPSPVTVAIAPPDKPAPIVAAIPAAVAAVPPVPQPEIVTKPSPVVSEPAKSSMVKPTPIAPSLAPDVELSPPVTVAIAPPAAVVDPKPAETPAAPAITTSRGSVEPIVESKPPASAAVAAVTPVAPAPKAEVTPAPMPVVGEPVKPSTVKPERVAVEPVNIPDAIAPAPAPKVAVPKVTVAVISPSAAVEQKPAAAPTAPLRDVPAPRTEIVPPVEPPQPARAVDAPWVASVEEKPTPLPEVKSATPIRVEPVATPETKAPSIEKPTAKPAPTVIAATPTAPEATKSEPKTVPIATPEPAPVLVAPVSPTVALAPRPGTASPAPVAPAQATPVIEAPKVAVSDKKPVTPPSKPRPEAASAPATEQIALQAEPKPAPQPVPVISAVPKPEPSIAVAVAPAVVPKPQTKPAEKPASGPASVAPAEVIVRPFTDAAAIAAETPEPAERAPEVTRAPVRPLQDRPQAPPPAGKTAMATAPEPTDKSKPGAAGAVKPETASTQRIAEAKSIKEVPAEKKPGLKPAPIIVHAPAGSLQSATPIAAVQAAAPEGSQPVAAPLKFAIERFRVQGNTVLKPETIIRVLTGYAGPQKDFGDVQRALEALQTAFQDAGYGAVQVTLPEQELDDGEVELDVIETRLGKIDVQGNDFHSEQNVRNSLPELKEGRTPNSLAIARNLRIANENSSKQTQVALRAGSQDGEVDATIKIIDDSPIKRSVTMDNTGTYATGKYRTGFGYQHANMFDRDHVLTLQYITSPEHPSAVTVLGFGYRVPLYRLGHSIDLIAGYSDVTSGTVAQLFNVSGAGTVFGLRYNQNLDRSESYEHKIIYGLDYRAFKNNVTFVTSTQPIVPDITVHPVSITYSGLWRAADSQLDFYGSYAQNIFPGGNDGANSDFQGPTAQFPAGSRAGAKAGYNVFRAGANYSRQIWGEWQARVVFAAQHTESALITGEQFGVGGAESVRGFDERAFSNDRGYRASFELYTPDMASKFGWTGGRIKFLVFYDTANLTRNVRQASELDGLSLDSYGLGLRLQTKNYVTLRVDYAQVVHDGGLTAGILDGRRSSNTLHASMVLVF